MSIKRFLSGLLALVLLLVCVPVTVGAAAEVASGTCGDNLTWVLDDSGTLTISGSGEMANYYQTAPWSGQGIITVEIGPTVTSIGDSAFYNCSSLTNVVIPDSVTSIGDSAFFNCSSLTSVVIPDSVTGIAGAAFYGCSSLTTVVIPDSVTSIGEAAFSHCSSLTSVVIPDSVTRIAAAAFSDCSSLTSVVIPNSVTGISSDAFYNCSSLTSVVIPDSVTKIVVDTFYGCSSLNDILYLGTKDQWYQISKSGPFYGYRVHYETETLEGHYTSVVTDPTCTSYGCTTFTCSCGHTRTEDIIDSLGHSYRKYVSDNNATCTANGTETAICDRCGNTDTRTDLGSMLDHDYQDFVTNATCTEDGFTTYICKSCGKTYSEILEAIGHDYQSVITGPTCTAEGYTTHTCSRCQDTYTDSKTAALDHSFGEWYQDKAPTVAAVGSERRNCANCDHYETREIPKLELTAPVVKISSSESSGKPKLTWESVGVETYKVYRATSRSGKYTLMKTTSSTSYTNTSAKAGSTYYYYVVAVTEDGTKSEKSNIVSRTCDLARPTVTLSGISSTGKIKVSWKKIDGAVSYKVYRATSKNGKYTLVKTTTGTSYTNTSAKAGTTYYYKVKAIHEKEAANSAYSSYNSRTCDLPRPDVEITLKKGDPRLTWDKIDGAKKYEIYRATSKNGTYKLMKTTTGTSYTNSSAKEGTTYYYKVKAIHSKSAANSAYSTVRSIKAK